MTAPQDLSAAADIAALRREIDRVDAQLVALIGERTAVSRRIGRIRAAAGGPRVVHSREMAVLDRFRQFGREGNDIGMALLRLGRGRLGGPAPVDAAVSGASTPGTPPRGAVPEHAVVEGLRAS